MTARKPIVLDSNQHPEQEQSGDPLQLPASVAGGASLNMPQGAAPTSPQNGDMWTTSAGLFVRINGATIGPLGTGGGGGGGGNTPTVRATTTTALGSVGTTNVAWPTGTVAGDLVIIFVAHGWNATSPAGWLVLDNTSATNWSGAVFAKTMSAADITAGSVTINFGGTYNGVVSAVTITGSTVSTIVNSGRTQNASGATSATEIVENVLSTDMVISFASTRGTTTCATTGGTSLSSQQGTNASGSVSSLTGSGAPVFTITCTFGAAGTGYYIAAVALR